MNYKVNGVISPEKLLDCVNLPLTDDAVEWVELNPDAAIILIEENSSRDSIFVIRNLFCERLSAKCVESSTASFDTESNELKKKTSTKQ